MADDLDEDWWTPVTSNQTVAGADNKESSKKKKRKPKLNHSDDSETETPINVVQPKKKKKKKTITEELAVSEPQPPQPSDLISAFNRHFAGKLSALEKDVLVIKESHFAVCSTIGTSLPEYLQCIRPDFQQQLKKFSSAPGHPLILVLTSAAIRAADVVRMLREFHTGETKIAKLFAKHMKLEQQIKFLAACQVSIGVGTPNRIQSLLDTGALHLDKVKYIIIDWSWRDVKSRRIIDVPETRTHICQFLHKYLISHLTDKKAYLALW